MLLNFKHKVKQNKQTNNQTSGLPQEKTKSLTKERQLG